MVFEEAVVTHGIEAKCASPRWRPNPEIDWHRDRYPRDMINPAGRNHVNRQRSSSSNAIKLLLIQSGSRRGPVVESLAALALTIWLS